MFSSDSRWHIELLVFLSLLFLIGVSKSWAADPSTTPATTPATAPEYFQEMKALSGEWHPSHVRLSGANEVYLFPAKDGKDEGYYALTSKQLFFLPIADGRSILSRIAGAATELRYRRTKTRPLESLAQDWWKNSPAFARGRFLDELALAVREAGVSMKVELSEESATESLREDIEKAAVYASISKRTEEQAKDILQQFDSGSLAKLMLKHKYMEMRGHETNVSPAAILAELGKQYVSDQAMTFVTESQTALYRKSAVLYLTNRTRFEKRDALEMAFPEPLNATVKVTLIAGQPMALGKDVQDPIRSEARAVEEPTPAFEKAYEERVQDVLMTLPSQFAAWKERKAAAIREIQAEAKINERGMPVSHYETRIRRRTQFEEKSIQSLEQALLKISAEQKNDKNTRELAREAHGRIFSALPVATPAQ